MEEKGREGGAPPATAAATAATTRTPEVAVVEQAPRRRAGAPKRKANSSNTSGNSSTPSKRLAKEKPLAPLPPLHNGPCTRARQSPNKFAAAAAAAAASTAAIAVTSVPEKPVEPVAPPVSSAVGEAVAAAEESNAAHKAWQALEPVIDAEFEAVRSRDANAHVVPTHAGWFSWTKIHPLEERAMASFFDGKSEKRTSDIYMEVRNLIMKKFHADPETNVESKDLSELYVGELDARQEVTEFLDHWGLINFHPFPPVTANAEADGNAKMPSLIEKLYRFETVQFCTPVDPGKDLSTPAMPPRLYPDSAIADDLVRPEGPAVDYHCNSCSADCSRKRYHCQKQADFDLCPECYNSGKFDSGMSPADFILMEPAEVPVVSGGSWTDQETLLLLEALELYGENWNEIAEHVATKTKAQCILHFVQMPIEDTFMEGKDDFDASIQGDPASANNDSSALKDAPETTESKNAANENEPLPLQLDTSRLEEASEVKVVSDMGADRALKALKEAFQAVGSLPEPGGSLSFAEAGNPVMALAAFLGGLVESDVAAASAHSSLKAISEDSPGIHLAARHCFLLEDPSDDMKEPPVSESAVVEMVDVEDKDKNQKEENQREENHKPVLDCIDASKDGANKEIEDVVPKEEPSVSPHDESTEKSCAAKEPDEVATEEQVTDAQEKVAPGIQEEVAPSTQEEVAPSTVKESSDPTLAGVDKPSTMKDDLALPAEVSPSSVHKSGDVASVGEVSQHSEEPKAVDMESDPVSCQEKEEEPLQPVASNSMVETGANEADKKIGANTAEDTKLVDCKSEKNCNSTENRDDNNFERVKRAAVTAISAAAVKAKLLANQEEDQIRQLATLLIEKQLRKLETKLAFFAEMESVIMRAREQMDRSRQRLYQERAQIIAARLGFPASSSRSIPPSLPNNKTAMGYANTLPKSLPSMTTTKPPVKRTTMALAPHLSNSSAATGVPGSLSRLSNQDKPSVGTDK